MSVLILVRHGQASFFADDYDILSPVGRTQSRLLGEDWARRGMGFDAVYTGPRARQRHTAEEVGHAYAAASSGLAWPEPVALPELDEYDLTGLTQRLAPVLAGQHAEFAALRDRYRASQSEPTREHEQDQARHFQKMFEALTRHWQQATATAPDLEAWPAFRDRVARGVRRMTARPGGGHRVVAFTSGGFIGAAVQAALGAPDRAALELSWRLRNTALVEFVFTHDRITLDSFNTMPHLEDPALWTYR
jgi:broad specificity phosphatase PhoE